MERGGRGVAPPPDEGEDRLNVFVEARIQSGPAQRTNCAHGRSPTWNEQLVVPFEMDAMYASPTEMRHCMAKLVLTVFDQMMGDESQPGSAEDPALDPPVLRRYLGKVEVPVGNIYRQPGGVLDGVITLDAPIIALGYTVREGTRRPPAS